jgi:hypothetical protein
VPGGPRGQHRHQEKYAANLQAFQQAVIVAHQNGKLSDAEFETITQKAALAVQAGSALSDGIVAVANGGGWAAHPRKFAVIYTAPAQTALLDLGSAVTSVKETNTKAELTAALQPAAAILKRAIALFDKIPMNTVPPSYIGLPPSS